jgi:hypothetical protein
MAQRPVWLLQQNLLHSFPKMKAEVAGYNLRAFAIMSTALPSAFLAVTPQEVSMLATC